ncbi:hypothetical protein BGZ99_006496 [Dissophora globulifera]|uniref:Uncharacterized protein n=1 Tax=Dissophora globulifera TaxID=979702 RepID=A0A9P6RCF0_9FUNG|nr:hypothetical protein BGZ99_006496 [Dissophora globulifera]
MFAYTARDVVLTPSIQPTLLPTTVVNPNFGSPDPAPLSHTDSDTQAWLNSASSFVIIPSEGGGRSTVGRLEGSHRVNGTMTLAYMACQMLPAAMHLDMITAISSTNITNTTSSTKNNTSQSTTGSLVATDLALERLAIEYYADQDCSRFVVATAGTKVRVRNKADDGIKCHDSTVDTTVDATVPTTAMVVDSDAGRERGSNEEEEEVRAEVKEVLSETRPARAARELGQLDQIEQQQRQKLQQRIDTVYGAKLVSIRWVGILSPTYLDSIMKIRQQSTSGCNDRGDTLEQKDSWIDEDSNINGGSNNSSTDSSSSGDTMDGFVSWDQFASIQLQPPPKSDLGPYRYNVSGISAVTAAVAGNNNGNGTAIQNGSVSNSSRTGSGSTGMSHATSQIVMAGLIAGLFLILGSLLTAVYYRQERRRWYEEDGGV